MLDLRSVQADALSFDVATVAYSGAYESHRDQLVSSFPLGQETGFSVLADGIGGEDKGDIASALVLSETFSQLKMKEGMLADGVLSIPDTLRDVLDAANQRIARHCMTDQDSDGMGSTLLTTVIRQNKLYWLCVGDAALLLYRDGVLRQLNQMHPMASQSDTAVTATGTTELASDDKSQRNTGLSALSGAAIATVDCPDRPIALLPDDIVIAASHGLQCLSQAVIAEAIKTVRHGHGIDIANALLKTLRDRDHPQQDNTGIVVIKLNEGIQDRVSLDAADLSVQPKAAGENEAMGPIARQLAQAVQRAKPAQTPPKLSVVATSDEATTDAPLYFYRRHH